MRRLLLPAVIAAGLALACTPPKAEPGIPITGTITSAAGAIAPLTEGVQGDPAHNQSGDGFSLAAVLGTDAGSVINVPSTAWKCYTPSLPQFPNFDIEATDGATYYFSISINPGFWGPGVKTIDGVNVLVGLVTADRAAIATAGTFTLTSAGTAADTAGSYCKFDLSNLPVFGERDAD